jgi:hypothetical protein
VSGAGVDLLSGSVESMMLRVEMMCAQDFDEQLRNVARKIKFLGKVKEAYRQHIERVQDFIAKKKEKNGDQQIFKATPAEMADLMQSFVELKFDLSHLEAGFTQDSLLINDSGDGHRLDEAAGGFSETAVFDKIPTEKLSDLMGELKALGFDIKPSGNAVFDKNQLAGILGQLVRENPGEADRLLSPYGVAVNPGGAPAIAVKDGKAPAGDYARWFDSLAGMGNTKAAREFAQRLGGDKGNRFFYADKANYSFEDGTPRISVFVEGLNAELEVMKGKLESVTAKAEELSTELNALTAKRTAALNQAQDLIRKMNEVRTNTIGKMG